MSSLAAADARHDAALKSLGDAVIRAPFSGIVSERSIDVGEYTFTLATIGDNDQRTPNLATIYVCLIDPQRRKEDQIAVMARIRNDVVAHQPKELRITVGEVPAITGGGGSASTVQYALSGPDLAQLTRYTDEVLAKLRATRGRGRRRQQPRRGQTRDRGRHQARQSG